MRHRGLLFIGLAALTARTATALLRPGHQARAAHPRPAYSKPDPAGELSAQLKAAVADELVPFARDEEAKKRRGEPYVNLGSRFEYLPAYGPGRKVAISVLVGGPVLATPAASANAARSFNSEQSRHLIFTYALVDGHWIEISKPRWETRERGTPVQAYARRAPGAYGEGSSSALSRLWLRPYER